MKLQRSICLSFLATTATAFQPIALTFSGVRVSGTSLLSSVAPPEIETLRVKEIKAELDAMSITHTDCFDRESLVDRLIEARSGKVNANNPKAKTALSPKSSKKTVDLDKDCILADLRSKELKELKLQCSRRNLRYASFLEKEDFVQAIWRDMEKVAKFSISGALRPGEACEITGEQLDLEMASHDTPLLLDVYATWCGPCKMMEPEFRKVAEELGTQCRVAKLDADKHPAWAGRFKVQGLPTTLIIHKGEVIGKKEGAHMKDQLLEFIRPQVKNF